MDDFPIPLDHLTLAARRWRGGPTRVLALHGWLDNAGSFDRLAPHLEADVVALDLPGHGQSSGRAPGGFYHFVDWIPDVLAAADRLGWDRFHLVGHSMGAGISSILAGTVPDRLESLVCIEGLGPLASPPEEGPEQLRKSLQFKLGREAPVYPTLEDAVQRLIRRGLTPEGAACLAARGVRQVEGGFTFAHDARTRWPSRLRLTEEHVQAFLREITCPVLFLTAPDGLPWDWSARAACVRDLRHVERPGGHHLHLDHPEGVVEEVRTFLAKKGRP